MCTAGQFVQVRAGGVLEHDWRRRHVIANANADVGPIGSQAVLEGPCFLLSTSITAHIAFYVWCISRWVPMNLKAVPQLIPQISISSLPSPKLARRRPIVSSHQEWTFR